MASKISANKPRARQKHGVSPGPTPHAPRRSPSTADEILATVQGQLARCTAHAMDQATVLSSISLQTLDALGELNRDAPGGVLFQKAHALRGLVLHGFGVLAELQSVAGHLTALAAIRDAEQAAPKADLVPPQN